MIPVLRYNPRRWLEFVFFHVSKFLRKRKSTGKAQTYKNNQKADIGFVIEECQQGMAIGTTIKIQNHYIIN